MKLTTADDLLKQEPFCRQILQYNALMILLSDDTEVRLHSVMLHCVLFYYVVPFCNVSCHVTLQLVMLYVPWHFMFLELYNLYMVRKQNKTKNPC